MANKTRMEELGAWAQELIPERRYLTSDLIAGLTFAVVNVPQAMGHALLATVNPVLGIFALMVASPIGAIFTGSAFMNVSTTAALSVAAGAALTDIPAGERPEALTALVLMVGLIQFLMGLFRLGSLTRFISNAVMTGFLNGVAVLIILGQLSDLTGYQSAFSKQDRPGSRSSLADWPDQPASHHRRRFGTGDDRAAAGDALAAFCLHHRRCPGDCIPGAREPSEPAHRLLLHDRANSWRHRRNSPSVASTRDSAVIAPAVFVATGPSPWRSSASSRERGSARAPPTPTVPIPTSRSTFWARALPTSPPAWSAGSRPARASSSGTALIKGAGAEEIALGQYLRGSLRVCCRAAGLAPCRARAHASAGSFADRGWRSGPAPPAGVDHLAYRQSPVGGHERYVRGNAGCSAAIRRPVWCGPEHCPLREIQASNKILVVEWVAQPENLPLEMPVPKHLPSHQLTLLHIYGSLFFAATKNLEDVLPDAEGTSHAVVAIVLRGHDEIGSTFLTVLEHYAKVLQDHDSKLLLVGVNPAVLDQLAQTRVLTLIGEENVFQATSQLGAALNQAVAAANVWLGQRTPRSGLKPL